MNDSTDYDLWAEIYDSVYSYVQEDIPFYVKEAVAAGGPVLELGCGTGRIAIPLAKAGVDVTGIDFSQAMLDVAQRKVLNSGSPSGSVNLVHADMIDFSLDEKFNLVIIPFRGFLSLLSVQDEVDALFNIKRHLAPGGKLIFNIFVPDFNMLVQDGDVPYHFRDVTNPSTGERFILWLQNSFDADSQVMDIRTIIERLDDSGAVTQKLYRDFQLRYIFRWEMHHLLRMCGYEILELYGDFDRSPFDEVSTEMIWVATPSA